MISFEDQSDWDENINKRCSQIATACSNPDFEKNQIKKIRDLIGFFLLKYGDHEIISGRDIINFLILIDNKLGQFN